jgi:flagellar basal body-associated protein FliL
MPAEGKKKKMPIWLAIIIVIFLFSGWIWFVVHKSVPAVQEDHAAAKKEGG